MVTLIKLIFLTLVIFAGLFLLVMTVTGSSSNVRGRLDNVRSDSVTGMGEGLEPFSERLLKPLYNRILGFFSRFTPHGIEVEYGELLAEAGMSKDYTPTRLIMNQVLFSLTVGGLSLYIMKTFMGSINLSIFAILFIGSIYLPLLYLRRLAKERKDKIRKDLPNILDMVYISVEAGLSFDAAMTMTASKMDNELSDEIMRAMGEINRGRVREDALYSIADRTRVTEVRSFIATIIQSEKLGSNIANVLRIQAEVIRDKRKQHVEETINKMPIKMLLPLVFLLLPALFIVIMGPAVINMMNTPF